MSLINFKNINCEKTISKDNKIIEFNGSEIQIINYLSSIDKYELIMATLQKSYEDDIYNPIKINMFFDLHLVYMYTNIVFDAEDKVDEIELYDTLKNSGLLSAVKEKINSYELAELQTLLEETLIAYKEYRFSIVGFLSIILEEFTDKIQNGLEALKEVNPETLQSILGEQPKVLEVIEKLNKN